MSVRESSLVKILKSVAVVIIQEKKNNSRNNILFCSVSFVHLPSVK